MCTRILTLTGVLITLLLSGCAEFPRHSNTLYFGTNTKFGVNVGTNAAQTPEIAVGYGRQELAIVPLLANKAGACGSDGCAMVPTVCSAEGGDNCMFKGTQGEDADTYSVLASFGADFNASSGATPSAQGGLAQYFATGLAARKLAGFGSSLVAVGEAAKEASKAAPALAAEDAKVKAAAEEIKSGFDKHLLTIIDYVGNGQGEVDETQVKKLADAAKVPESLFEIPSSGSRSLNDFEDMLKRNFRPRLPYFAETIIGLS